MTYRQFLFIDYESGKEYVVSCESLEEANKINKLYGIGDFEFICELDEFAAQASGFDIC